MKDFLQNLNERQRSAVVQTEGPLLILAGAGSGKTRAVTHKIAYLIGNHIAAPEEVLAVTFTNKAAEEMRNRVHALLEGEMAIPVISTFHSFGLRLLRRHAGRLDYRSDFNICDAEDQRRLLKRIYADLYLREEELPVRKTQYVIGRAKSRGWDPETFLKKWKSSETEVLFRVFDSYERYLRRSNSFDFDDLIGQTVELLKRHKDLRESYGERFHYLLIDEYQDTNGPQYQLVKNLTSIHQNISAVGDEDQSIYGFRGADINNILRFERDFPGATVVRLEQNYRSTQTILDAASAVVSNNVKRKGKRLWTDRKGGDPLFLYVAEDSRDEATFVALKIREYLKNGPERIAILYRTNFQSRQFEEVLRHYDVAYRLVGGVSFYNRREVKDVLAYLRVAYNPDDDVSLLRIINLPPRGIGKMTLSKLSELASQQGCSLWSALHNSLLEQVFSARGHRALQQFVHIVEKCQEVLEKPLTWALEKILEHSGYGAALMREDKDEDSDRLLNLKELITVAREYEEGPTGLQAFLDHASLRSDADDYDEAAPVTLMTLHNAKGLEFPIVFLAGCEDGLFPHSRSLAESDLEEERRLCYVGLTRAQRRLHLSYSRRRRFFGREGDEINRPSRFLGEIPRHLVEVSNSRFGSHRSEPRPVSLFQESLRSSREFRSRFDGTTYNSVESVQRFLTKKARVKKVRGLVSGALIVHEKFGQGRVLSVEPVHNDLKVTVQFPGRGIKKMLQSYANLRPL